MITFKQISLNHHCYKIVPSTFAILLCSTSIIAQPTAEQFTQAFSWHNIGPAPLIMSPHDPKVLYGSGNCLFRSANAGQSWEVISPLQQMNDQVINAKGHLFAQRPATLWENVSRGGQRGHFCFAGENPPTVVSTSSLARARFENSALVTYYIGEGAAGEVKLEISDLYGKNKHEVALKLDPGIHLYRWDLSFKALPYSTEQQQRIKALFRKLYNTYGDNTYVSRAQRRYQEADNPQEAREAIDYLYSSYLEYPVDEDLRLPMAGPGTYRVILKVGDDTYSPSLVIREDPLLGQ